jgi:hypothetical protein
MPSFGDDDEFEREMEAKAAAQTDPAAQEEEQAAGSELDEEGDDTVKSINDALRGLFR